MSINLFRSVLLVSFACVVPSAVAAAEPPNIVFILADDLAWSDLGCYGNTVHETPNIDRLAEDGVRFTQAYAPAPICSASRAAILTGKTPARLNFEFVTKADPGRQQLDVPLQSPPFTLNLPLSEVTLGEALAEAGYATGFFGKWHVSRHHQGYLGWSPTHGPLQQGFVEGDGDFGSHPYAYRADRSLRDRPVAEREFPDDTLVAKAVDFVERHKGDRFFLYLSQYFVHDPVHSRCGWLIDKYRHRLPAGSRKVQASYAAMVETLDALVGRLLDTLERAGLAENTLVVLMSDNGGHPNYTSNAPLRGSKWNLYEGGIRIPLIARWPGRVEAGRECDAVVHGCDLFATFCDIAGTAPETAKRDGVSLVPVLTGSLQKVARAQPLVWHFPYYHPEKRFHKALAEIGVSDFATSQTRPQSAVRSGDWKLLYFYEDDRVELYDLSTDLAEQHDLATSRPEIATRLQEELVGFLTRSQARMPVSASGGGSVD